VHSIVSRARRRKARRYPYHGFESHDTYLEAVWCGRLADLRVFQQRTGERRAPRSCEDPSLARWVRRQRLLYRSGDLWQDRYEALVKLGLRAELEAPEPARWDVRLQELAAFRRRFGHCRVPYGWLENPALARWVHAQRGAQVRGELRPERRRRLAALGFEWKLREVVPWAAMYAKLLGFQRTHGHADVSAGSGDARLLHWVTRQRQLFREGRLPATRRAKLERLGFRFRIQAPRRSVDERLAELRALWRRGRGRPNYWQEDRPLAAWIKSLRRHPERLSEAQCAELDALGVPVAVHAERWDALFERLLRFRDRHGHAHVPSSFREDPALAHWVAKQRARDREGTLEPERRRKLDSLGIFEIADRWEEQYAALARFVAANGHARVPASENAALASWVVWQRRFGRAGTLARERMRRLDGLGFCWDPHESAWQEKLVALRAYRSRQGHCDVPHLDAEHHSLGSWVAVQRRSRRLGQLSRDRIRALDGLGFTWNPRRTTAVASSKSPSRHG
jgi:hypothetical protein